MLPEESSANPTMVKTPSGVLAGTVRVVSNCAVSGRGKSIESAKVTTPVAVYPTLVMPLFCEALMLTGIFRPGDVIAPVEGSRIVTISASSLLTKIESLAELALLLPSATLASM
jgi:hypothetical protein